MECILTGEGCGVVSTGEGVFVEHTLTRLAVPSDLLCASQRRGEKYSTTNAFMSTHRFIRRPFLWYFVAVKSHNV